MTYVISGGCAGIKDGACVQVCPCDCIHDAGEQFVINPDECIDCGACALACPVGAIFQEADVPTDQHASIVRNREFFL
ncbi:ferredoxin family protein [Deinococcus sp. KSM4-11]|uniref:indolepyruvate ferredoxin oxidoreductase subunit alpha n=1 Tax=Deinococcus sp. KSM4-11 TaxID=2568654 RepID=UPI0010A51DAE|nr:ferredoxin family protein [Deinococcus sp. KSM4-11]THF85070.1 ferredoxin family protein [Deinococcus sp. KSM4-11]